MAIPVECPCGRKFTMPDFAEGERIKCAGCGKELTVPDRDPTLRLVVQFVETKCKCGQKVRMSSAMCGDTVPCYRCGAMVKLPNVPGSHL